jgi:hypothetical protein
VIGTADDHADTDGTVILNYGQAQTKAVDAWRVYQHRALTGNDLSAGPYTVAYAYPEGRGNDACEFRRGGVAGR